MFIGRVVFWGVVASTLLFFTLNNVELRKEKALLELELKRTQKQMELIKNDISIVQKIKDDNNRSGADGVIERLRLKGYLRD